MVVSLIWGSFLVILWHSSWEGDYLYIWLCWFHVFIARKNNDGQKWKGTKPGKKWAPDVTLLRESQQRQRSRPDEVCFCELVQKGGGILMNYYSLLRHLLLSTPYQTATHPYLVGGKSGNSQALDPKFSQAGADTCVFLRVHVNLLTSENYVYIHTLG